MARALYGGRATASRDDVTDDLMALTGITREAAESWAGSAPDPVPARIEVLSVVVPAVRLFAAMVSQWRLQVVAVPTPAGPAFEARRTGLDLGALDTVARWLGIEADAQIFQDVRTLEAEALSCMDGQR